MKQTLTKKSSSVDKRRSGAVSQPQTLVDQSRHASAQLQRMQILANSQQAAVQRQRMTMLQRAAHEDEPLQAQISDDMGGQRAELDVPKPNNTGLPNQLKTGIESLSGMSMDHVKVHYNSAKPAQLQAHAYAQGSEIHVAPGQEKHLPHEAWHVVQQAQGRVKPTMQMKAGVSINDDSGLEAEADVMGERALQSGSIQMVSKHLVKPTVANNPVVSRYVVPNWASRTWNGFPDNFVISDDSTAATGMLRDKLLYATAGRRAEANAALIAAASPVRIEQHQNGEHFDYDGQTINRLEPVLDPAAAVPMGVQVNATDRITHTPSDCMRTAERIVGHGLNAVGQTINGGGNLPGLQRLDTLARLSNLGVPAREALADGFIHCFELEKQAHAYHRAYQLHRNDMNQAAVIQVNVPEYGRTAGTVDIEVLPPVTVNVQVSDLADEFDNIITLRDQAQAALAALEAANNLNAAGQVAERKAEKLDKFADPAIGQAYASVAGGAKVPGQRYWNYHWGGVIMKTPTDNITLENHADRNDPTAWDIRMYGRPRVQPAVGIGAPNLAEPKNGQSWHEQWSERDFGGNPSTMVGR
jgi:hypothetical protein